MDPGKEGKVVLMKVSMHICYSELGQTSVTVAHIFNEYSILNLWCIFDTKSFNT